MKHLILITIFFGFGVSSKAQDDTLSIKLSSFTKREGDEEKLFLVVFIKSLINKEVVIDDNQEMILCPNTTGVKLIEQYVDSSCYVDVEKSDCHPLAADTFPKPKKTLPPWGEYSYVVDMGRVLIVREKNGQRQYLNIGDAQRFKLQIPFSVEKRWFNAKTKGWHYFAYNSR